MKTSKIYTHKVSLAIHSINKQLKVINDDIECNRIISEECKRYELNEKNIRTIGKFGINYGKTKCIL